MVDDFVLVWKFMLIMFFCDLCIEVVGMVLDLLVVCEKIK